MCFEFTQLTHDIVRCRPNGPVTLQDSRKLRAFLQQYRGRMVVDLRCTTPECTREFARLRMMLPQTAFYGSPLPRTLTDMLPGKEFYMHEVRHFETEAAALAWLNEDHAA